MKKMILIGAALLSTLISFNSMAQRNMSPEEMAAMATANRQAVFKLLAFSMGPLQGMARGGDFDQAVATKALERIQMLAPMIPELFAASQTTTFDIETRALHSIWTDMDGFASDASDLATGATEALAIINSQGADGVRAAVQLVGPKCGACHDAFRAE